MSPNCSSVRQSLIGSLPDSAAAYDASPDHLAHVAECAACSLWWRRQVLWVQSLGRRLEVPAELDARVGLFADPSSRRERALAAVQSLRPLSAPSQLEERVQRDLGTRVTRALGRLETRPAPDVLERLVTEEFTDPAAASVRRHAGRLARLDAPVELERGTERLSTVGSRTNTSQRPGLWRQPVLASVALAAAAVLAWVVAPRSPFEDGPALERTWSFEIVRATPSTGLDEVGLGLLDGLSGGVTARSRDGEDR